MPITGTFAADFSDFQAAVDAADVRLKGFEESSGRVETALSKMTNGFTGVKVIQDATLMAEAIERAGGVATLTASELATVGAKAEEAAAKIRALGGEVPASIQKVADASRDAASASGTWKDASDALGLSWVARISEGALLADAIREVISVAKDLAAALPEVALQGAKVADVEDAFKHLTSAVGLTSDALLGSLRTATHGTVTDFELMKAVNQDLAAGMNLTQAQFTTLATGAFELARKGATDTTSAMNSLNDAMLTGRTRTVALITGKIDATAAEKDFAAANKTTVDGLSAEGKLDAVREAILGRITDATARLGQTTDGLAQQAQQASTAWANFTEDLGKAIARSATIESAFAAAKQALIDAYGGSQASLIDALVAKINDLAVVIVDFGLAAAQVATVVLGVWNMIKTPILGVETLIVGAVDLIGEAILKAEKLGENLHLVPPGEEQHLQGVVEQMRAMTSSLAEQTKEAALAAVGVSAENREIDKLGGVLFTMRDAMMGAHAATVDFMGPIQTTADLTAAAAKAAADHAAALFQQTEAEKKFAEVVAEVNSAGGDWKATLDTIDGAVVENMRSLTAAGVSLQTLEKYYGLTTTQGKAFTDMLKDEGATAAANERIWAELQKATDDYYKTLEAGSHDATQKAIDDAYLAADAKIAAMYKAKSYSLEAEAAIWAAADQTATNIVQKEIEGDTHSKAHFVALADEARVAYEFASAHADQYTSDWINQLDLAAQAAQKAADTFGTAFVDNSNKSIAAIQSVSAAMAAMGGTASPVNPATGKPYTNVEARSAGYLDMNDSVTVAGSRAGFGAGPGGIQYRAAGGPVSAGAPYMVGEAGPELFTPDVSGSIAPNGSGAVTVVNHFNIIDTEAGITRRVSDNITRSILQGRKLA